MAIKKGKNGVNEELPDEYEVIQHSLRNSRNKEQQDSPRRPPRVKKPAQTHQHKTASSSNGISGRNKH